MISMEESAGFSTTRVLAPVLAPAIVVPTVPNKLFLRKSLLFVMLTEF